MSRMLDLIRASALSYHQMISASKGALHVPAPEMVEILVYLAEHNKIFADTARLTLASWDEEQSKKIAADPNTPKEVLDYWLTPNNIRPALFPILIENSSVRVTKLSELAATLKGEVIDVMIASPRVQSAPQLLQDLSTNHQLSGAQAARVQALISGGAGPTSGRANKSRKGRSRSRQRAGRILCRACQRNRCRCRQAVPANWRNLRGRAHRNGTQGCGGCRVGDSCPGCCVHRLGPKTRRSQKDREPRG